MREEQRVERVEGSRGAGVQGGGPHEEVGQDGGAEEGEGQRHGEGEEEPQLLVGSQTGSAQVGGEGGEVDQLRTKRGEERIRRQ